MYVLYAFCPVLLFIFYYLLFVCPWQILSDACQDLTYPLCPPPSRLPRRRRIFTDWPEHRGDLPRDKQFHHIRRLDDHPSVLRDGHMAPDEQARVSDSHAGELH